MTIEVPMVELAGSNGSRLQEKKIYQSISELFVIVCIHTLRYNALRYITYIARGFPKGDPPNKKRLLKANQSTRAY